MQVQQMIRASADVLTITRLSPGDVYKRVEENSYGIGATLRFGVVQDVMNNGEDSAVTALEYEADYTEGAKTTVKVWTGSKPAALFPATPEEVTAHLAELVTSTERALAKAEEELAKRRAALAAVHNMTQRVGELSAPQTAAGVIDAAEVAE